jgi:hypothetical protein
LAGRFLGRGLFAIFDPLVNGFIFGFLLDFIAPAFGLSAGMRGLLS